MQYGLYSRLKNGVHFTFYISTLAFIEMVLKCTAFFSNSDCASLIALEGGNCER